MTFQTMKADSRAKIVYDELVLQCLKGRILLARIYFVKGSYGLVRGGAELFADITQP
jgi:hypothetical protein